jgi:pyrroline-5-carboxylate reductase
MPLLEPSYSLDLSVIGGGAMGSALLKGVIRANLYPPSKIGVREPDLGKGEKLATELGVQLLETSAQAAAARLILLAVKPQIFPIVAREIGSNLTDRLIISIMAGISLETLESNFSQCAVVRTMPNTPALVGAGITAIACSHHVTPDQQQEVIQLFEAIGSVALVSEDQMDAVTALSGSGPGYLALLTEALIDGGVSVGLSRALATQLTLQTLLGTARLLQEDQISPAELKDRVTSPGGTTITGITVLEEAGVRGTIIRAIQAAHTRSQALGSLKKSSQEQSPRES